MTNERCELRHRLQEDGDGGVPPVGEREDGGCERTEAGKKRRRDAGSLVRASLGYVGCGWYGRGAAYYAVNTVHIGMRAAGKGITTALAHPPTPHGPLESTSSLRSHTQPDSLVLINKDHSLSLSLLQIPVFRNIVKLDIKT